MTRWILPALFVLSACGDTVCDYSGDWAESCGVTWTDGDQQLCIDRYRTCTRQEKQQLEAFWLCMDAEGALECNAGGDTGDAGTGRPANADALLTCKNELRGVGVTCTRAIGIEGGEFAGLTETATTTATP